jgi:hypothetical protein
LEDQRVVVRQRRRRRENVPTRLDDTHETAFGRSKKGKKTSWAARYRGRRNGEQNVLLVNRFSDAVVPSTSSVKSDRVMQ